MKMKVKVNKKFQRDPEQERRGRRLCSATGHRFMAREAWREGEEGLKGRGEGARKRKAGLPYAGSPAERKRKFYRLAKTAL